MRKTSAGWKDEAAFGATGKHGSLVPLRDFPEKNFTPENHRVKMVSSFIYELGDVMKQVKKMQAQMERIAPGICRKINLRAQRFNQDESPGALLVEVGAAGNTHSEALTAVEVLARAVLDLSKGSQ